MDLTRAMQAATEDAPAFAIDIEELITRERRRSRTMPPCQVPTHPGAPGSPKTQPAARCEVWFRS